MAYRATELRPEPPDYLPEADDAHHLGIRNVNARLKMIYGEDAGLKLFSDKDATVSSFTIPFKAASPIPGPAAQQDSKIDK